jgi:hypothetical protein
MLRDGDGDQPGDGDGDLPGDGDGDGLGGGGGGGGEDYTADFVEAGLGTAGDWNGYLVTAAEAGSSISPSEITTNEVCVSGMLGAGYEEWALVGWNIAQVIDEETGEGGEVQAIAPGGTGVVVDVANLGGSGLRVQIQTDDLGTQSWCAPVPDGGAGVIAWEDFRTECWTTTGEAYDGTTPIAQVAVQTYAASDTTPTEFEYCVLDLGPAL